MISIFMYYDKGGHITVVPRLGEICNLFLPIFFLFYREKKPIVPHIITSLVKIKPGNY